MKLTREIEKTMRYAVLHRYNPECKYAFKAISQCLKHWEIRDLLCKTNRAKIFKYLYMDTQHYEVKEFIKCNDVFVSQSTLERYRKQYARLFVFYLTRITENSYLAAPEEAENEELPIASV